MVLQPAGQAPAGEAQSRRIEGLDGLRGVAALLVVVHHALLLTPALIAQYRTPRSGEIDPVARAFSDTPLHLLWDGPVAVFVFFVLSGFVLTLPFRTKPRNWLAYYPARLIRLYIPVWAAVALGLAWEALLPRLQPGSSWVQGHRSPTTGGVLHDLLLIAGAPGATNSALWSLRWEVLFSLLLPAFIAFAVLVRRLVLVKLAALLVLMLLGARSGPVDSAYQLGATFQLPVFALGCLLAVEWEQIRDSLRTVVRNRRRAGAGAALAVLLLSSYWLVCAVTTGTDPLWLLAITRVLQVLGAGLLVALSAALPSWGRWLSAPATRWLGTRSFSLYLVHEPLVTALGRLLPQPVLPIVSLAIAVPASLAIAEVFFRFVERPSHRVSREAARMIRTKQRPHVLRSSAR